MWDIIFYIQPHWSQMYIVVFCWWIYFWPLILNKVQYSESINSMDLVITANHVDKLWWMGWLMSCVTQEWEALWVLRLHAVYVIQNTWIMIKCFRCASLTWVIFDILNIINQYLFKIFVSAPVPRFHKRKKNGLVSVSTRTFCSTGGGEGA